MNARHSTPELACERLARRMRWQVIDPGNGARAKRRSAAMMFAFAIALVGLSVLGAMNLLAVRG